MTPPKVGSAAGITLLWLTSRGVRSDAMSVFTIPFHSSAAKVMATTAITATSPASPMEPTRSHFRFIVFSLPPAVFAFLPRCRNYGYLAASPALDNGAGSGNVQRFDYHPGWKILACTSIRNLHPARPLALDDNFTVAFAQLDLTAVAASAVDLLGNGGRALCASADLALRNVSTP